MVPGLGRYGVCVSMDLCPRQTLLGHHRSFPAHTLPKTVLPAVPLATLLLPIP